MSEYNLLEANKMLINSGAYLARDMDFSPERKPMGIMAQRKLESRVERWRESAMKIVQQHQAAHKEIQSLKSRIEALESPWISVADELPEKGGIYYTLEYGKHHGMSTFVPDNVSGDWFRVGHPYLINTVTHWMPLPPHPKEQSDA